MKYILEIHHLPTNSNGNHYYAESPNFPLKLHAPTLELVVRSYKNNLPIYRDHFINRYPNASEFDRKTANAWHKLGKMRQSPETLICYKLIEA